MIIGISLEMFSKPEKMDFRLEEVKNYMTFGSYIEELPGHKNIDYKQVSRRNGFSSFEDYLGYSFITSESVNKDNYKEYEFVMLDAKSGIGGSADYVGLLVNKATQIPCGHLISK